MTDKYMEISTYRFFIGILLAPLSPIIPLLALAVITGASGIGFWFKIIAPISYGTAISLGLPIILVFRYLRVNKLWPYIISGALAAVIPIFYVFFSSYFFGGVGGSAFDGILPVHYGIMVAMVLAGVMVSTVFWLIARPD